MTALHSDTISPAVGKYCICRNGHIVYIEAELVPRNIYCFVGYQCAVADGMRTGMHQVWTEKGTYYAKRVSTWDIMGMTHLVDPVKPEPLNVGSQSSGRAFWRR